MTLAEPPVVDSCPRVQIVLVNYNTHAQTIRCLRSLEKLDYPNYQIVLVNNGSPSSGHRIREAFPDLDILESSDNLGFAGANNLAIAKREAALYWLLNNDTVVDPQALSELVCRINEDSQIGAVGSKILNGSEVECLGGYRLEMITGHAAARRLSQETLDFIVGTSFLFRREALDTVGFWDDRFFLYWEDADYSFRLRRAGYELACAEESVIYHEGSASTGRHSRFRAYHLSRAGVRFMRIYARWPVLASAGLLWRLTMLSFRQKRWGEMLGLWHGFVEAWMRPFDSRERLG